MKLESLEQLIPKGISLTKKEICLIQVPIDFNTDELKSIQKLENQQLSQTENARVVLEQLPETIQNNISQQLFPLIFDSQKKQWTAQRFKKIFKLTQKYKTPIIKKKNYRKVTKIIE